MSEMNPATASTRVGIEFLTLWMESGDAARLSAIQHIQRILNEPDGPSAAMSIISGLLNLSMLLVFTLAREQGAETDDALTEKAGDILRDWSRQFPE
jgi:hypothetical protein